MNSGNQQMFKAKILKSTLAIVVMFSAFCAMTVTPAAAFEGRGDGGSGYRHRGLGTRGHDGRSADGVGRSGRHRQERYGNDVGYGNGYDNGYGSGRGGVGGIIGGLIGGN